MFRKLRTHLVLVNMVITTLVLVIAFATIYITARNSMEKRKIPREGPEFAEFSQPDFRIMEDQMRDDRRASLNSLLISLITVGAVVEMAVVVLSYYLASVAIRPVQKTYEAQKVFIANASHEIKTPLAAISANLEAADIQNNRWIDNVGKEVQKLSVLNGELLQLAQADNLRLAKQKSEIIVRDFLDEVISPFDSRIKDYHLQIKVTPKDATINVQSEDLRQVLTILLDNAVKYGHKNLELCYENHEFCVKNDGKTIPSDKLAHVFERFYQVDKSTEGSGLGLAIAKAVAERNNWDLGLISENKMTIAKLKLR